MAVGSCERAVLGGIRLQGFLGSDELGFADVDELFLGGRATPVPAAGAVAPLDAGVVLGLVPVQPPLHQPVRPQAFVGGCD